MYVKALRVYKTKKELLFLKIIKKKIMEKQNEWEKIYKFPLAPDQSSL